MTSPEASLPPDPFLAEPFERTPVMEKMFSVGVYQGLIEHLRASGYADAALVLATVCEEAWYADTSVMGIDEQALAFVKVHAPLFYEDALVVMTFTHQEWQNKL